MDPTHDAGRCAPDDSVTAVTDERLAQLQSWLARLPAQHGIDPASARPASSDASFRRYFRVDTRAASLIVMDAPPAREDCRPFVHVAGLLARRGVNTPRIRASNLEEGFLLLDDLGSTTYADALRQAPQSTGALYADALAALVRLQTRAGADAGEEAPGLPTYDRARLLAEMRLFPDWYLARHLQVALEAREQALLEAAFETLADAALAQSQVLVHRDYHCRNLMRIEPAAGRPGDAPATPRDANPGVLDFQDAVLGPITYDVVSLLRDAYVAWPEAQQIDWAARYWEQARSAQLPVPARFDDFWRDLEWMGLQRSLKVLGIFARLCYRDGKSRYLGDLPVVLTHAQRTIERYDAFAPLARLFDRVHERPRRDGYTF
jgi:aminoglycoside/choline kinase family phosphotransferase